MASCAKIARTLPVTLNASRIVISDDPKFINLAKRTGNDAFLRVGTLLTGGVVCSPSVCCTGAATVGKTGSMTISPMLRKLVDIRRNNCTLVYA